MAYKTPAGTKVTGTYQPAGGAMTDAEAKTRRQTFTESSKKLGYKVTQEGDETIATPPKKTPFKPIIDRVAGDGTAQKINAGATKVLSKVTGVSEEALTRPRKSIAQGVAEIAPKVAKKFAATVDNVGKKVVDVASDVMSYPQRKWYNMKREDANIQYERQMEKRKLGKMDAAGVPDKGDESDPLFRYRANKANKK